MSKAGMLKPQRRDITRTICTQMRKDKPGPDCRMNFKCLWKIWKGLNQPWRTWLDKAGEVQSGAADTVCGLANKSRYTLQGSSGSYTLRALQKKTSYASKALHPRYYKQYSAASRALWKMRGCEVCSSNFCYLRDLPTLSLLPHKCFMPESPTTSLLQ